MPTTPHDDSDCPGKSAFFLLAILAGLTFAACMPPPPAGHPEEPVQTATQSPPPPTEVIFYPNQDQSPEQQDLDSYECYLWAVNQTGFDPSATNLAPHQKVVVVSETPPGVNTAGGAVKGAMMGAVISPRHNRLEGAIFGALAGALFGSVSDVASHEKTTRLQKHYDSLAEEETAELELQAEEYRRALSACLEGRGYTVR